MNIFKSSKTLFQTYARFSSSYCYSLAAQKTYKDHLSELESRTVKTDAEFHKTAYIIGRSLFTDERIIVDSSMLSSRYGELIDYAVETPFRKREEILLHTFRTLAPKSILTDKQILHAHIIAFCSDLFLSCFLIVDDIIDGNTGTRRYKPCWHVKAGPLAVIDAMQLSAGVPIVFQNFLAHEPYYQKCLDVLTELTWQTCCLEGEDNLCAGDIVSKRPDILNFDFYRRLANIKMGFIATHFPVLLGMHMAGFDPDPFDHQIRPIVQSLGFYLQSMNDYRDRYGINTGKTLGEDIKTGKLTWLLLTALKDGNSEQKAILQKCYGHKDEEKVNAVIDVYDTLKIKDKFHEHEKEIQREIFKQIQNIENPDVQKVFKFCLEKAILWYS